jgi:hypothetical protein
MLGWLVTVSTLRAEIQDIRDVVAEESKQYWAQHFPDGHMPPKHDWREKQPSRRGETPPTEAPGGVGYGFYFNFGALTWTNSTVADYYVITPTFLGGYVSELYLTSTCRAQLGTESLIAYSSEDAAVFWVYDWAQPAATRWQTAIQLTTSPQYLGTQPDEFALTRQMIHLRNGTYYRGFSGGLYNWQNQVMLFNFNRGDWDLVYSYDYGTTNLTDNIYTNGAYATGFWGPIVETFGTYTNVNPVGFDLIRFFQDDAANAAWLNTGNSHVEELSSPWQLLTQAPNTSFTAAVSSNTLSVGSYNLGTLCVTATTNAASFSLSPPAGIISSNWVITPGSNRWDNLTVGLPPAAYTITFNPLPGLAAPAPQTFSITNETITTVQADYGTDVAAGAPQLSIIPSGRDFTLTWPTNFPGYVLQSTTNLDSSIGWSTNAVSPAVVSGQYAVTNPASGPRKFYRLFQ